MMFIILGVLVIVVFGFFYLVWKAAPDWRWYNIVASIFLMLLSVAFLFPTAGVLKSRQAWHQKQEQLEKDAQKLKEEQRILKYGNLDDPNATDQGVITLGRQLSKLGLETGRVWRSLQRQSVSESSVTLAQQPQVSVVPGQPAGQGVAATQPLIPENSVVYAFAEAVDAQQVAVPYLYLGEYQVASSTPTEVTLRPTGPLEPVQQQGVNSPQSVSWSLYELLPLDGHEVFVAEGSVSTDENFLGRVESAAVEALMKDTLPETLKSYLDDGRRALPDDPPISRWTKVEFDKPYTLDVDSPEQRGALESGFFDGSGRAVDARLQNGGEVSFESGDQLVLKEEAANQLIDGGIAHLVDQYYLRPLNDYRFILRHVRLRIREVASRIASLQYEKETLEEAIEKTNGMSVINQDLNLKLEQDLAQFRVETEAIKTYTANLREQVNKMRTEMSELYRRNIALEEQLDALQGQPSFGIAPGSANTTAVASRSSL